MTRCNAVLTTLVLLLLVRPALADEITTRKPGRTEGGLLEVPPPPERTRPAPAKPSEAMTCGRKHFCREMTSCAEARFYLGRCGLTRLDRDRDGIPCEPLCP